MIEAIRQGLAAHQRAEIDQFALCSRDEDASFQPQRHPVQVQLDRVRRGGFEFPADRRPATVGRVREHVEFALAFRVPFGGEDANNRSACAAKFAIDDFVRRQYGLGGFADGRFLVLPTGETVLFREPEIALARIGFRIPELREQPDDEQRAGEDDR